MSKDKRSDWVDFLRQAALSPRLTQKGSIVWGCACVQSGLFSLRRGGEGF